MAFDLSELRLHDEQMIDLLTEHLPDMLWVKDIQGTYIYANKAICDNLLMAKDIHEPIGKNDVFFALREREAHKDRPDWHTFGELCFNSDQVVIDNNKAMRFEEYGNVKGKLLYLEVYKAPFYDESGNIIGTVGAGRDITEMKKVQSELKKSLEKLAEQRERFEYQANHDALTDLPNRTLFLNHLEQLLNNAKRYNKNMALLFIDLDNFKEINDSLGHNIGDIVLVEAAKRIDAQMRKYDNLARLGGDEFCIVLYDVYGHSEIEGVIKNCMRAIETPFIVGDYTLHISMSVGISLYPEDGNTANNLLKNADAAMYKAKHLGKNTFSFYDEEMTYKASKRLLIERELKEAMHTDQLKAYFQPQIDAKTDALLGMEVLCRWFHPQRGLIMPDQFIPLAENNGMIIELDRIVMKDAFTQFMKWKEHQLSPQYLSINLSIKQIEEPGFVDFLVMLMEDHNISNSEIHLEVTETCIMNQVETSVEVLDRLSKLGIKIVIDDFGTGYSSLAYLKRLPINTIKIDKSFVDSLPYDEEDIVISKTIIDLCKNLKLDVIAEGIETEAQKNFMLENGCHQIQGYYYSKPLSAEDMKSFLLKHT